VLSGRRSKRESAIGGKYRLIKRLATGGMGEVWVAQNRSTGAEVAIKLRSKSAAGDDAALRFRHEARLGAMLSHRSIVRVFDLVEESDDTLLLVMELLRGETLERHLTVHGPLPTREAIAIALPVLSALAHAHDFGVVHRDITPANIFLAVDPDGHVIPKLVDFGIAKVPAVGVQTVDGRVLGTPRYMAPERIRAQGEIDGRSDLFSVGVVLYEMLTGTCPFAANSPAASLAAVLESTVDPDLRIDPLVWIEVQRALSKRAYERHGGAHEMAAALLAASGDTEANLAERLRRLPIPRGDDVSGWLSRPARSDGGHSFRLTRAHPESRGVIARWVVGGILVLSVAFAASAALLREPSESAGSTSRSAGKVTEVPHPTAPDPPLPPPAAAAPSAISGAAVPVAATSNPSRPAHIRRAKPVATSPGF
jgi:serine/threonine protein kinase